jgi:DNA (cytosine-5)-methyltransferase 1
MSDQSAESNRRIEWRSESGEWSAERASLLGDPNNNKGPQGRLQRRDCTDKRPPWASELVNCRDGKRRPIEPGTFPLAHGVPHRVGLLRGYGNAIVPQVAAAFIEAYLSL